MGWEGGMKKEVGLLKGEFSALKENMVSFQLWEKRWTALADSPK